LTVEDENNIMAIQMKILFPIVASSIVLCSCMSFKPPAKEEPPEQPVEVIEEAGSEQIEPEPQPEGV